jgi:hypothetical protein
VPSVHNPSSAPLAGTTLLVPAGPLKKLAGNDEVEVDVGAVATSAVCAETAVAEPPLFDAVTAARSVDPTSPLPSAYEADDAPLTFEHAPPLLSQRRHWYAYEVGEPLQLPTETVSVWPATALPLTTGNAEFTGADTTGAGAGAARAVTTAVAAEVATEDPFRFDAVTATRKV